MGIFEIAWFIIKVGIALFAVVFVIGLILHTITMND